MIIKRFEEIVERYFEKTAIKTNTQSITYGQLNSSANRVAHGIQSAAPSTAAALLFEHGADAVTGVIGTLKAGKMYVPLDINHPETRLVYMLEHSGAAVLLTNRDNRQLAERLAEKCKNKPQVLDIHQLDDSVPGVNPQRSGSGDTRAYILYTSGSTGNPKGVVQSHRNVLHFIDNWSKHFSITPDDRVTLLSSLGHDAAVPDIFSALLNGATLYPYDVKQETDLDNIAHWLTGQQITLWHSVPTFFRYFLRSILASETFPSTRMVVMGGEEVRTYDIKLFKKHFPNAMFANLYGQSESTINSISIVSTDTEVDKITLGQPIDETEILLVDESGDIVEEMGVGEIVIASPYLALEYLNDPEGTGKVFTEDDESGRLYWTGDMGQMAADGSISMIGRKDFQVKIRGYRVETAEIESVLLEHGNVKEAVVTARKNEYNENYLCAYIIPGQETVSEELRNYTVTRLPEYMIPRYFIQLEQMPLTATGKVDRAQLPEPDDALIAQSRYAPPTNETERKIVAVWEDVLEVEKIGIYDNFIERGGHSLLMVSVISRIHQEFNVELQLKDIFDHPTVKELALFIAGAGENTRTAIEPAPEKEYYAASPMQRKLYILNQLKGADIAYNLAGVMNIDGPLDRDRLAGAFQALVQRHESLRTSFHTMEDTVVQKVHPNVHVDVKYHQIPAGESAASDALVKEFIRPFDLSRAPLLRVELVKQSDDKHILLFDMHHIIADGISLNILIKEIVELYEGKDLPPLRIQFKDYSQWQAGDAYRPVLEKQEQYWLDRFSGEIPVLNMPTDYPRPAVQSFAGDFLMFKLDSEFKQGVSRLLQETGTTVYMLFSAACNILLSRYSGQEDIVLGTVTAGRDNADLEDIIGLFINVLPIRNYPDGAKTFRNFLEEVKSNTLEAFENQAYSFGELVEKLDINKDLSRNPLYDVEILVQNFGFVPLKVEDLTFTPHEADSQVSQVDLSFTILEAREHFDIILSYCTKLFKKETIQQLARHFENILRAVIDNPTIRLSDIHMLGDQDRAQVIDVFNQTPASDKIDNSLTLDRLFQQQVEKTPDNTAIVGTGYHSSLTYRQLDQKANNLARLLKSSGVGPEVVAGLIAERSPEMIIALLAILKAGGSYLYIDPQYPIERARNMLKDSRAGFLLGLEEPGEELHFDGKFISLGDPAVYNGDGIAPSREHSVENAAYVIYTSGSTGKPKGVVVEHRNVAGYVNAFYNEFDITSADIVLQQASATFDVFIEEVFPALLSGAAIAISPPELTLDIDALTRFIKQHHVTILSVSPLLLNELNKKGPIEGVRIYISGGDLLKGEYTSNLLQAGDVYNTYGPAESTVCAAYYKLTGPGDVQGNILIGKPVAGYKIFILDKYGKAVPCGVPGELCIAGAGVARGYLNRPDLNREKFPLFSPAPGITPVRIYKTGDLARWMPDGNIEFLGRLDNQVKIRGYRIEPGEIENRLLEHPGIREALVLVKGEIGEDSYLAAYIAADPVPPLAGLRSHLSEVLPAYMIPAYFVSVDSIPVTPNGKVDTRALPEPASNAIPSDIQHEAAAGEIEIQLVDVWQQVLGRKDIGIHDNFFMMGGDSIKAIQIVSRMNKAKFHFEIKDLFSNPTISELAPHVKPMERVADQSLVTGPVKLTPIQQWFFQRKFRENHHFNQSVMLYSSDGFNREALEAVFTKIQEHHDALRMTYREENLDTIQVNNDTQYPLSLEEFDYRDFENKTLAVKEMESTANRIQAGIDLQNGPMMKLGLFRLEDGDRLLIAVHHLVIDGVSWRILLEDIETLYHRYIEGKPLELPLKTDSFQVWAEKLSQFAATPGFLHQKTYWKNQDHLSIPRIPKDFDAVESFLKDTDSYSITLSKEETQLLLGNVNRAFGTEINDILLAALGLSLKEVYGHDRVLIGLEGHGRESILEDVDVNRTVGWFTSMYPLVLDFSGTGGRENVARHLKNTKESIRKMPDKGVGYAILKYLTPPELKEDVSFNLDPQISFNYLGQFGGGMETRSFGFAGESSGNRFSPEGQRVNELSIAGMITDDVLSMGIAYSRTQYKSETMERLMNGFKVQLERIIAFCAAQETPQLTPSDLTYKKLSIESLESLEKQHAIEDIYALTPMQEGMLFHALMEENSATHFVQLAYSLSGRLDIPLVHQSLDRLYQRHAVLRTAFISEGLPQPAQVVLKDRKADFVFEDIRQSTSQSTSQTGTGKEEYLRQFKLRDRTRSFDLSSDGLMRVAVIQTGDNAYEFIWSFHHIVMDAWCTGILVMEFFEIYDSLLKQRECLLPPVRSYSAYIKWLERHDKEKSRQYWTRYLDGYPGGGMSQLKAGSDTHHEYRNADVSILLDPETTNGLNRLAGSSQVTLNTVLQSVWSIILGLYTGRQDVAFGEVVSGRPADIEGIESIVGLFINTIPVRIRFREDTLFSQVLKDSQQDAIESESHHHYPLAQIQSECAGNQQLVDHLLVFENLPLTEQMEGVVDTGDSTDTGDTVTLVNTERFEQSNYDFYISIMQGNQLSLRFIYNEAVYDRELIERMARHYRQIVNHILENPQAAVSQLALLGSGLAEDPEQPVYGEPENTAFAEEDTSAEFDF